MKYMGSKQNMLRNGLGTTFFQEIGSRNRIIDLFSGSASVAWFAAQNFKKKVVAVDLQAYSQILANSVLKRRNELSVVKLWEKWFAEFERALLSHPNYKSAISLDNKRLQISEWSSEAKKLCSSQVGGTIWNAYGGFYFSPFQALVLDLLIDTIPFSKPAYYLALAAIISSASKCAASPGHTAQPFKANDTAGPYLKVAWEKDPIINTKVAFDSINKIFSKKIGNSYVMDAIGYSNSLKESDLVFLDPPYSGVHYSRFYHVLETIARGSVGEVTGTGRYPSQEERPFSEFSRKSESLNAFRELIYRISAKGSKIILTYPDSYCSNGLSGDQVLEISSEYFKIKKKIVESNFSTLGGNNKVRSARHKTGEMILVLEN